MYNLLDFSLNGNIFIIMFWYANLYLLNIFVISLYQLLIGYITFQALAHVILIDFLCPLECLNNAGSEKKSNLL